MTNRADKIGGIHCILKKYRNIRGEHTNINYAQEYVAFIDILGFSNFIFDDQNAEKVKDIFEFVGKFQHLFNTSPELNTKIAFFSDSIVLTTDDKEKSLTMLFLAVCMVETHLRDRINLYFRGGLTKGLYYHEGSIAFGPAIVKAYQLECQAKYSRIILDENIVAELNVASHPIIKDLDGCYCFNPYSMALFDEATSKDSKTKEKIFARMRKERELLCDTIHRNLHTRVADKYLWRIHPYNKACDEILAVLQELNLESNESDVAMIQSLKIVVSDFEEANSDITRLISSVSEMT